MDYELELGAIKFPNVYTPDSKFGRPRYSVAFERVLLPRDLNDWLTNSREVVSASSFFAPMVSEVNEDYEALVRAFGIADARNIKRDVLLRGAPARLGVTLVQSEFRNRIYRSIGLRTVTINANHILQNLESL